MNTKLEKSRLLPELNFAYNNMSMQGSGADDKLYNSSTRFQSAQIGIGIPLFYRSQKARIIASRVNQRLYENSYQAGEQLLKTEYAKAVRQYSNALRTLNYYETASLKNATLISSVANQQFANGDINYLEWVMLTNQAISIRNDYLIAVSNYNESVIRLNFYITK